MPRLRLGTDYVDVVLKNIKNVHLTVHPPHGRVRIAAPLAMDLKTIRLFAISKLTWIRAQQAKLRAQERETAQDLIERESHQVWGRRYLMTVIEHDAAPRIERKYRRLFLYIRPESDHSQRQAVLDKWHRDQVRTAAAPLIAKWEKNLGVKVRRLHVQRMKTKWGSCRKEAGSIRLNSELAKKPCECLEYIVVHELAHLLEPTHNARFVAIMDNALPQWRHYRDLLNRLPLRYEEWEY